MGKLSESKIRPLSNVSLGVMCILLICHLCINAASALTPSKLQIIEIKQRQDQTVLILKIKPATVSNFFTLSDPNRLVIDLNNAQASSVLPKEIKSNGFITGLRLGKGPNGPGQLRLVADLSQNMNYVSWIDENADSHLQTINLVLTPNKEMPVEKAKQLSAIPPEEAADLEALNKQMQSVKNIQPLTTGRANLLPKSAVTHQFNTQLNPATLAKVVVTIDPGHGGKDSGAIGPFGDMEKNVVLAIALKLQKILNQMPGIDARLTRKGDYFIPLRQRLNIARRNHSTLFMAIHADAFNETASGASVFALSPHGATSEAARWLAERENTSELCGINIKTKDKELKSLLIDMSQTATIQSSLHWGSDLLRVLKTFTPLHAYQVEQAGFVVLKSPDIPSVLIETGFITNPKEESLLTSPAYQNKLAAGIAQGTTVYLAQNPPPDSWFEMNYKNANSTAN